jgi:hypothetical protein
VQGARVLTTEGRHDWGSGAPRTGVVSYVDSSYGILDVTWDDTGQESREINPHHVVLLAGA